MATSYFVARSGRWRTVLLGACLAGSAIARADAFSDYKAGRYASAIPQLIALKNAGNQLATAYLCESELLGRGLARNLTPRRSCFDAAHAGVALAMGIAAQALVLDIPEVRQNIPAGLAMAEAAAKAGDPRATRFLGDTYLYGYGHPADQATALAYYRAAYALGEARSATMLGTMSLYGTGLAKDVAQGLALLKVGTERGDNLAQYRIFQYYFTLPNRTPQQTAIGIDALYRSANAGLAEAQYDYGYALLKWDQLEADPVAAYRYWRAAAQQGHTRARLQMALAYLTGNGGVASNNEEAARMLRENMASKDEREADRARVLYALMIADGRLPANSAQMKSLLALAARSRYPEVARYAQQSIRRVEAGELIRLQAMDAVMQLGFAAIVIGGVVAAGESFMATPESWLMLMGE